MFCGHLSVIMIWLSQELSRKENVLQGLKVLSEKKEEKVMPGANSWDNLAGKELGALGMGARRKMGRWLKS